MSPKNLSYFIDLQNFPISEPESSKYQKIIKEKIQHVLFIHQVLEVILRELC